MNNRPPVRRGLGRGLGSLIPSGPATAEPEDAAVPAGPEPEPSGGSDVEAPPPSAAPLDAPSAPPAADWIGRIPPPAPTNGAAGLPTDRSDAGSGPNDQVPSPAARSTREEPVEEAVSGALRRVEGARFAELPVESVSANPRQPRQVFDEEAMAELVHSIREVGLLQPVVVRETAPERYELIMGERRLRATQQLGLATIPAIVRETGDDAMLRDALLENLHRAELNPLEEAAAYQQLLDDFGCTHEELASRIGRSRPQISNTLRLLKLSPAVQRRVAAGVLSAGHARTLLSVADPTAQDRLANRVVAEGISVRGLEELVAVGELGEEAPAGRRQPRRSPPELTELTDRLSDVLDTRVKVDVGRNKGRLTIEFASLEDLHRIVGVIDATGNEAESQRDD